jgi:CheY-like chemotaxis protein
MLTCHGHATKHTPIWIGLWTFVVRYSGRISTEGNPTVSSAYASLRADMSAISTVRIMLVEDHLAFRQALASLLSHEPDLEVVAQAGSLAQARKMLDRRLDVAVVDLGLPDGDGSALIGELRRRNPGISVLVLSAAMGPGYLDDAVKARADAVLDKVASIPTIAEEVRRLAGG